MESNSEVTVAGIREARQRVTSERYSALPPLLAEVQAACLAEAHARRVLDEAVERRNDAFERYQEAEAAFTARENELIAQELVTGLFRLKG